MWPFSRSNKSTYLVIDLGSASIGVACVVTEPNKEPMIVAHSRIPLAVQSQIEPSSFLKMMMSYLSQALDRVTKKAGKRLRSLNAPTTYEAVFCVFSSPWYATSVHELTEEFDTPRLISSSLVTSLVHDAYGVFVDTDQYVFDRERFESEPLVIEQELIEITLNGYRVSRPYGKTAEHIDMLVFVSAIPNRVADRVERTVGEYVDISNITFRTQPTVSHYAFREIYEAVQHAQTVMIGGEHTEIVAIEYGVPVAVYSFPLGFNEIVRKAGDKLTTGNELALSLLSLHGTDHLDDDLKKQLKDAVSDVAHNWAEQCDAILQKIDDQNGLVSKTYLVAPETIYETFADVIRHAPSEKPRAGLELVSGGNEYIRTAVTSLYGEHDIMLAIGSLFAARIDRA